MAGPGGALVGRVSIQVLPDTSSFREKLRTQLSSATKGLKVEIPVEVQSASALAELAAINTSINKLDNASINVNTEQIGQAASKVSALSSAMASATNKAKAFSTATRSMSRGIFLLTTAALGAAPAVGTFATVMAGLPSLAAAAAASFAALALGWEGMKNAASTLSDEVKSLKSVLSAEVEASFASVFKDLAEVFPTLESGLSNVVNGLADMAQGFANAVTSAEGIQNISTYLSNLGDFLSSLQPMVENFTSAFLQLAASGSKMFGMLSNTLNTFAANFNRMIQQVTSNGTFKAAMSGLNQVLNSVLGLFNQLFKSGLKIMGQIGGPLADAIKAFGDLLKVLLPILTDLTTTILEILTPVLKALTPIVKALQPFFQQLGTTIQTIVVPAVQALAPILKQVAMWLSKNAQWIVPLIASIYLLNKAYKVLNTTLGLVVGKYRKLRTKGQKLKKFYTESLIPTVEKVNTKFKKTKQKVKDLGDSLKTTSKKGINSFKKNWNNLKKTMTRGSVIGFVIGLIFFLYQVITNNWDAISQFLQDTWDWIEQTAIDIWNSIKSFFVGIFKDVKNGIVDAFNAVVDFVTSIPNKILTALGNLGDLLLDIGHDLITGFWNGIQGAASWLWGQLRSFFSSMIPDFVERMLGIASPSKVFRDIGQWVPIGFAKGIEDRTGDVVNAASKMSDIGNVSAHVGVEGDMSVDEYDSLPDIIGSALANWEIAIDREGLAEMVNYTNRLNARRG